MTNKNIITVTNLIKMLDRETLRNHDVVVNLIRSFGLVQWGPPVFGADEVWKNHSQDMAGIYQTPAQMAKALVYLSAFEINSYAEIGVFQGGNFLFVSEYLRRFNPEIVCVAIDPTNYLNPEVKEYIGNNAWMTFKATTSEGVKGGRFDLVFIDGDHSAEWVRRDWDNLGQYAKICMIHDIQETSCPAVTAFWGGMDRVGKTVIECLDHSSPVPLQGIGIIHDQKLKGAA
ncbi:MAG: hypothetical protein A4E65_03691 [Syntrophorhabdus sp. PtaU1.Bin153]|nr:MAG: hypothetical protein A4E65_03691 [Syntrophorhabdus sp. PtaU1.Bin153]